MALSFQSVQKAYTIFNQLKPYLDLQIPSWPNDAELWSKEKLDNPPLDQVIGFGRKSDDGWENLFFVTRNPSPELRATFDELKNQVPNTAMNKRYMRNENLWIIGWI